MNRRMFLRGAAGAAAVAAGVGAAGLVSGCSTTGKPRSPKFSISLAEWSLHRALFGRAGTKLDHLDFPRVARQDYGIEAIELVNQFFKDKAEDTAYLREFQKRASDFGTRILLIMIDGEGALGDPDAAARGKAVENHHKWVQAARFFGCHSIRVNADTRGSGSFVEQQDRAADGLRRLSEYGAKQGISVIVENHGGLSSNGEWLAGVMRKVNLPNCGTLPDFGNFALGDGTEYDRYKGVAELMPFAKAVSAKTHDFDAAGNETRTDYRRMMKIVLDAGYRGWVGIEYEGDRLSEPDGIRASKRLLDRLRTEMGSA